jgi:nickel/cobalt transporter (NiCoT) family protein
MRARERQLTPTIPFPSWCWHPPWSVIEAATFKFSKRSGRFIEEHLDLMLASRGFFSRIFRRLFRVIERSWHMYQLGLLFGLGFDTATEVGLLGISATQAAQGMSAWTIRVFPALFTAGMTLMDTTDSILMLGAYGWAFVKPLRKLCYKSQRCPWSSR